MTFKVLFVCSANVCRSPSAAVLLSQAMLDAGLSRDVTVSSAGTNAVSGQLRCVYVGRAVKVQRPELEAFNSERSRAATPKRVGMADLILCADHDAVSKILRAHPRVRSRVFTMVEGAHLASRAAATLRDTPDAAYQHDSGRQGGDPNDRLTLLVAEMDAARGEIPLFEPGLVSRLLRRTPVDPNEILDVHARGDRPHKKMLRNVSTATTSLARAIADTHRPVEVPTAH